MSRAILMQCGSGDLLADRRYAYAEAALAEGDAGAARDLFIQTLERVAHWPPARLGLAKAELALSKTDEAMESFRAVAALDPDDLLGARAYLARMGTSDGALTPGYVAALFDDYAPRFDAHLTAALEYRAPQVIAGALQDLAGVRTFRHALDLGCGTGLMAKALDGRTGEILGVDLSDHMLRFARETGLYARLDAADCVSWLACEAEASADLVVAADVFCYIENLEPVFRQTHRVLENSGLFAFTIQTGSDPRWRVGDDLRVHHGPPLIRNIACDVGFVLRLDQPVSVRKDGGNPVPGALFVLERNTGVIWLSVSGAENPHLSQSDAACAEPFRRDRC